MNFHIKRRLSRDICCRNVNQAHCPINHSPKKMIFFLKSCHGPMALLGEKFHFMIGVFSSSPKLEDGRTYGTHQGKRCWDVATSLTSWWRRHRGANKRGLPQRFPADKTGNSLCAPQLGCPCSSLLCYNFGRLFNDSSNLSSSVHFPAHTATLPNVTTKREKKEGSNYKIKAFLFEVKMVTTS